MGRNEVRLREFIRIHLPRAPEGRRAKRRCVHPMHSDKLRKPHQNNNL